MVGGGFRLQQFVAADLAFGIKLADARLLVIGQTGRHRSRRDEHGRDMAERQRCNRQPRHDLVADAEKDRSIEHVVRQADGSRHGDYVARKQRQFHRGLALGDAIAHGWHAARHLRNAALFARSFFDQVGKILVGRMGRQHVVVSGDDPQIGFDVTRQIGLFGHPAGGKAMGKIAAGQRAAMRPTACHFLNLFEIGLAAGAASLANPVGDGFDLFSDAHGSVRFRSIVCPALV